MIYLGIGLFVSGVVVLMYYGFKNAPLVDENYMKIPKDKEDKYVADLQKSVDKIIDDINKEDF